MSLFLVLCVIVGIFLIILAFCALVILLEKKFPSSGYDERQKAAQGRANRLGMISGMIYFMVVIAVLIRQVDEPKTVEPYLLVFIGVLLMLMIDHAYCFLTHSSLPFSQNPMTSILCYAFGGVAQLLYVWDAIDWFPLAWVGHNTAGWIHLLTGTSFLLLAAMHLVQYLQDRKE